MTLRDARADDEERMFVWRNDPFLVPFSTGQRGVARDEHARWFQAAMSNPRCRIEIVEVRGEPAGVLRFERSDEGRCVISVYLAQLFTGQGYGVEAIRRASRAVAENWSVRVVACVRSDNASAARAFVKAGYVEGQGEALCPAEHRTFVFDRAAA